MFQKYRKFIKSLFLTLIAATGYASPIRYVIFDLHQVLVHSDSLVLIRFLGLRSLISYTVQTGHRDLSNRLKNKFFSILSTIYPEPAQNLTCLPQDDIGNNLPHAMIQWLDGSITGKSILRAFARHCSENPETFSCNAERNLIMQIAKSTFNPYRFIRAQKLHSQAISLIQECKRAGLKVYILSNWDERSFSVMRKKYDGFFDLFDGIVISGAAGTNKPEQKIYLHLLEKYQLNPAACLFVDDQRINTDAAEKLGITTIICPQQSGYFYSKRADLELLKKMLFQMISTRS